MECFPVIGILGGAGFAETPAQSESEMQKSVETEPSDGSISSVPWSKMGESVKMTWIAGL